MKEEKVDFDTAMKVTRLYTEITKYRDIDIEIIPRYKKLAEAMRGRWLGRKPK